MIRLLAGLLAATLLVSCTNSGSDSAVSETEAFKTEMDTVAARLLPDLMAAVGGRLNGMQATFHERGGFGIWDYTASGTVYALSRHR